MTQFHNSLTSMLKTLQSQTDTYYEFGHYDLATKSMKSIYALETLAECLLSASEYETFMHKHTEILDRINLVS